MVCCPQLVGFQSTLPRGERRFCNSGNKTCYCLFQSTLPRGERRTKQLPICSNCYISIHAPTRGATKLAQLDRCVDVFQSTLPRGERHSHDGTKGERENISIHAPTRGATSCKKIKALLVAFQSTLPRGERPLFHSLFHTINNFNPRSHEGSDAISCKNKRKCKISIHAPTRGATDFYIVRSCFKINFNPRSHEGSDTGRTGDRSIPSLFQSTLPRGERQQFSPKSSLFSQQKLSKIFNLNNKLF